MTNKNIRNILIIIVALITFAWPLVSKRLERQTDQALSIVEAKPSVANKQVLGSRIGKRIKTSGCVVNGNLPDPFCTPGDILPEATTDRICVLGYTKNVRNVPTEIKNEVFAEYGVVSHPPGEYEVDHLISLELGGSNDIANLWPEAAEPRPGFHEKDRVENYLHQQVCGGLMKLNEAQIIISSDWTQILGSLVK